MSEIVCALRDYGLSQAEIDAVPPDRLSELWDLVLLLSDSLTPQGIGQWLHAPNRLLSGEHPFELLASGRTEEVHRAAQAFVDGAYV